MKIKPSLLTLALVLFASTTFAKGIRFTKESKWSAILSLAKKQNKLIFLDAYASWCGPCKYLQEDIFTTSLVGDFFNKQFINVKMDMEKGEGIQLAEKLGVTAYPTLFFINGDGELVHKYIGAMEAEELVNLGIDASDPTKQFYTLKKEAMRGIMPIKEFHDWVHKAIELKDEDTDFVISSYVSKSKYELLEKNMLEILIEHTSTLDESMINKLYANRKKVQELMEILPAKFDEHMLEKIRATAELKSKTMAIPDFIVYNNFISKYIPAKAKLETQKFKLRYFESKKLDQKLLDELAITLADNNLNLSTSDMAYFVYSNSKLIVEKQSHAKFIKLINEFKIPKGEEEKAFTKNFAFLSIYAELKDKKKIEEYQSKLVIDPKVPDKIMDWALSL